MTPEHAAHPDPHLRRRRQARVRCRSCSASSSGESCSVLRFPQGHPYQRTLRAHHQFVHIPVDAVGAWRSSSRCGPEGRVRRNRARLLRLDQLPCPRGSGSTAATRASSARPTGSGANIRSGSMRRHARRQVVVGGGQQVVEQDERRIAHHRQRAAHHDGRRDRQQQAGQGEGRCATASRDATGRYSAITDGFCMNEEFRPAIAVVISSNRLSTPCARRSSQAGQPVQRPGPLQPRAQDRRRDDAHHRVTGEAAEDFLRGDQPRHVPGPPAPPAPLRPRGCARTGTSPS